MKRTLTIILTLILTISLIGLFGCGKKEPLDADNPVTLTMWHNFGGEMQKTMDELIDEFNSTIGREKGIIINVTAISSSAELQEKLDMIANGDPGAPEMPDIFTAYPKTAIRFQADDKLVNFDDYFDGAELANYVDAFVKEGRFNDGLYVFPFAKSTEVLFLNRTLFDQFAKESDVTFSQMSTLEGIMDAADKYYKWSGGKTFFTADSWLNVMQSAVKQQGGELFKGHRIDTSGKSYRKTFNLLKDTVKKGGIAVYDGYSSDLSKTGDIICSTGSSAGILFYGDRVTYNDNTTIKVEYNILPYPVVKGGEKIAIQRGNGLCVAKSDESKEYAACVFLKWFTEPGQNMRFISSTGYLPVTKKAFENEMGAEIEKTEDGRIKMMLETSLKMYDNYQFYTAPVFDGVDQISATFEKNIKAEFKKLTRSADW